MRKQEGCRPWGGGTQRSFYFCLKVTIISNRGAALATRVLSPLNCSTPRLLCCCRLIVPSSSTLVLAFFFFSPSSVSHSLLCSDVSFTTDWGTCVSLLFSWIMHINSRGQTEWVFRDNDWSDGTWAPLDCAASELVIKRQGRRGEGASAGRSLRPLNVMNVGKSNVKLVQSSSSPSTSTATSNINNTFITFLCLQQKEDHRFKLRSNARISHLQNWSFAEWEPYQAIACHHSTSHATQA